MFKQILAAVDGTSTSTGALQVAIALAIESKGTLHVLHVVDERLTSQAFAEGSILSPAYMNKALNQLRANGRKILDQAQKAAAVKGAKVNPLLIGEVYGDVASAILRQAGEVHADVIVLGTHGRRGLTRVLMGSDAEAVLREASVPGFLVRAPSESRASRKQATSKRSKLRPSNQLVHLSVVSPSSYERAN